MERSEQPIEIHVLGPVEAVRGTKLVALGGPRQRALLALLAIDPGRPVPVDRLIDELWGESPPDGSEATLRTYVSRLRAALGEGTDLRRDASFYSLTVPAGAVDAIEFERLIRAGVASLGRRNARAASDQLRSAVAMWRGQPFGDLGDDGSLGAARTRLEELRLLAIEMRIQADIELDRAAGVVDELESLVGEYPYRERLWHHLMLALYRSERQSDALSAFQRARAALDEHLGVEPGPGLQDLQIAILRQEVPLPSAPAEFRTVPEPLSSFVGRDLDLERVAALIASKRLVTLTGVGGVGKTRLAIEAARRLGADVDAVSFVDLSAATAGVEVLGLVAGALDVVEQADRPLDELIAARIGDGNLLIVLDNCEHVREAAGNVAASILGRAPGARILATSRETLGVPGEAVYPVPPLGLPEAAGSTGAVANSESVALFVMRAHEARSDLTFDDEALAAAARICAVLDGLPLAIELAAARARALSLPEIARRLDDRFRFLVSWRRLASARHRTLRQAMDWSHDLLEAREQAFLAQLGVFIGGFTLSAAAAVGSAGDEDAALRDIERLAEASLVTPFDVNGSVRYRMLETVRQYAEDRLTEDQRVEAADRHARYFVRLATERLRDVERLGRLTPLSELGIEDANLRAAARHLGTVDPVSDGELELCASLWRYWWLRGQLVEGRQQIRAALERAGDRPSVARVEALRGASSLALRQGDVASAVDLGEQSLEVAIPIGGVALARAQLGLANALASAGEIARADDLYHASSVRFREAQLDWDLGIALLNLADLAFATGDLAGVERAATESLEIFRRTGDDAGIAVDLGNLAFVALARNDLGIAASQFREALERSNQLGFREWISIMVDGLAAVAARRGDFGSAARLLGSAEQIRGEIGAKLDSIEGRVHAETVAAVRGALGPDVLETELARGRSIPTADAVSLALSTASGPNDSDTAQGT